MMKITVLGTRGEIPDSCRLHSKHSCILIDDQLMIDLGEKSFLKHRPKWILLTHLHPDHAYFVRRGKKEAPQTDAPIYAPEAHEHVKVLSKRKKLGPYTIVPIPTHHSKLVKSQAYLIKKGKQAILYTGDLVWINKEFHRRIGHVDLVLTEASFLRKGGMVRRDKETGQIFGHNGIPNLLSLLSRFSKTVLFMHYGSWFYKNPQKAKQRLLSLSEEYGVKAIAARDGLRLVI